jgi:hypothetical protein
MTREGYLFQWKTEAPACQPQWPTFRHDQQDSGNYDHDGTPPDAPANVSLTALGGGSYRLAFTAPGDDGPCGTAATYLSRVNGKAAQLGLTPVAGGTAFSATITLPAGSTRLTIQARDDAGNLGAPVTVKVR